MTSQYTFEDKILLKQNERPFSDPIMFTCTYGALINNIKRSHIELTHILEPSGAIKAINSNFGHKAQPGYEKFKKKTLSKQDYDKKKLRKTRGTLTPANIRQRKPEGDATCFNSAIELIIIPDIDDNLPKSIKTIFEKKPEKYYAVKSFPTTGQFQVPGVLCPNFTDGTFITNLWANFLMNSRIGTNPDIPIRIVSEKATMTNFKFHLIRCSDRIIFNLSHIVEYLEALKIAFTLKNEQLSTTDRMVAEFLLEQNNSIAWTIYTESIKSSAQILPFPIREIKSQQDGQNLSFKFVCVSNDNTMKKIRINIFYRGKVNILGADDFKNPQIIYEYICNLIKCNWSNFICLKPLSDHAAAEQNEGKLTD
jgi:hypothetical protein